MTAPGDNLLADARAYATSRTLPFGTILSVPLTALAVTGTPTLLLVDENGQVVRRWTGLPSPAAEVEVANSFGVTLDQPAPVVYARLDDIRARLRRGTGFSIVDARDRRLYAIGHLKDAISMPLDELEARAIHEINLDDEILLVCEYSAECETTGGRRSVCSSAVAKLREVGFKSVAIVTPPLEALALSGLPLERGQ